jgi:hypothetical protein
VLSFRCVVSNPRNRPCRGLYAAAA